MQMYAWKYSGDLGEIRKKESSTIMEVKGKSRQINMIPNNRISVGFEVVTQVVMNMSVCYLFHPRLLLGLFFDPK
jgi:hypothetical protein